MFGSVRIRKHERGLWFRHGDFKDLLKPGKIRLWSRLWSRQRDRIEIVSTLETRFDHPLIDMLASEPSIRDALLIVDVSDTERALIWKDNRLASIVGPGRHAFWREPYDLRVETFDVNAFSFEHPQLETVVSHADAAKWLHGLDVDAHEQVVLFRDGRPFGVFEHGRYFHWQRAGRITWKSIDLREQITDVSGQEIMTRDKVTLRVTLLVCHQVIDTLKAVSVVADHEQALYREAQLVLRAAIGTRTLDALLTDKEVVGREVAAALSKRAVDFGLAVRNVGLRDIILPGEMKAILNQVIEAEKQAQANLIRRREETAAARSQANTARLLAENPTLARMKELEALSDILSGTRTTFVLGGGDLSEQIRGLVGGQMESGP